MEEKTLGANEMKMKQILIGALAVCVLCAVTVGAAEKSKATSPLPPSKGEKEAQTPAQQELRPPQSPAPQSVLDVAVGKIVVIVGNTADEIKTTAKERAAISWTLQTVLQASALYQQEAAAGVYGTK